MHRIYVQAERTLLWLGACDEHIPAFLDMIRRLDDLLLDGEEAFSGEMTNMLVNRLLAIFRQVGERHPYLKARHSEKMGCERRFDRRVDSTRHGTLMNESKLITHALASSEVLDDITR